jgi:hypothetical protein
VFGKRLPSKYGELFSGSRKGAVELVLFRQFGKQASGQDLLFGWRQRRRFLKCFLKKCGHDCLSLLSLSPFANPMFVS